MGRKNSIANRLNRKDTMSTLMGDFNLKDLNKDTSEENIEDDIKEIEEEILVKEEIKEESKQITEITPVETTTPTNSYSSNNINEVYRQVINLRKADKEQDNEIKVLLYTYATDVQIKAVTDEITGTIKNVRYIDKVDNSLILGKAINMLSEKISQRSISDSDKNSLFTQLMIDFIMDRLKFIAKTELMNESTPKYIEQCMNDFFLSAPDTDEQLKNELIQDSLKSVIYDVENFVERKTFYMTALSTEALKTYCRSADCKFYEALNKFILNGLSNEDIGKDCISIAKKKLFENGSLKQSEISSKKLKKYDI